MNNYKMYFPQQEDILHTLIAGIYGFFAILTYFTFKFLKWAFPKMGEILLKSLSDWFSNIIEDIIDKKVDEKFKKINTKLHEIKNAETGKQGASLIVIELMEGIYNAMGDKQKYQEILDKHNRLENDNKKEESRIGS